jgi:hypothetical protein
MSGSSDLFEDIPGEVRRLEQQRAQLLEEAKTATPERRKEIGWWMWGATKHRGRLADAALARRYGEHRFMIHEVDERGRYAVCSCGARFEGRMHESFTLEEFAALPGHRWAE